jgi:hypothetical protein
MGRGDPSSDSPKAQFARQAQLVDSKEQVELSTPDSTRLSGTAFEGELHNFVARRALPAAMPTAYGDGKRSRDTEG